VALQGLTNRGRLSSRRWQSFPTASDGTGLTCGQHIESHSCIFSFPNRTVTSLFKQLLSLSDHEAEWTPFQTQLPQKNTKECPGIEPGTSVLAEFNSRACMSVCVTLCVFVVEVRARVCVCGVGNSIGWC
jgi:hypothetical protein